MNDSKSISDYFDWVQTIVNHKRINDEKLDVQWIVEKIMQFLIVKFDYVVVVIKEGKNIFTLRIDEFIVFTLIINELDNQFY